jgi:hypothetical protein
MLVGHGFRGSDLQDRGKHLAPRDMNTSVGVFFERWENTVRKDGVVARFLQQIFGRLLNSFTHYRCATPDCRPRFLSN